MLYVVYGVNAYGDVIILPYEDDQKAMTERNRQEEYYKNWAISPRIRTVNIQE